MYRPASVSFPVPASPIFFAGSERAKSALAGRLHRSELITPLLNETHEEQDENLEEPFGKSTEVSTKMIRNKKDLLILIALCMSYYNAFCAFSMIAPIFPLEVRFSALWCQSLI